MQRPSGIPAAVERRPCPCASAPETTGPFPEGARTPATPPPLAITRSKATNAHVWRGAVLYGDAAKEDTRDTRTKKASLSPDTDRQTRPPPPRAHRVGGSVVSGGGARRREGGRPAALRGLRAVPSPPRRSQAPAAAARGNERARLGSGYPPAPRRSLRQPAAYYRAYYRGTRVPGYYRASSRDEEKRDSRPKYPLETQSSNQIT